MSSKSAVKALAGNGDGALFRLVAILTGSKNALKGVGFFLGAALLSWLGYRSALVSMAAMLGLVLVALIGLLDEEIGKSKTKTPLRSILSKSDAINRLSAARFFDEIRAAQQWALLLVIVAGAIALAVGLHAGTTTAVISTSGVD